VTIYARNEEDFLQITKVQSEERSKSSETKFQLSPVSPVKTPTNPTKFSLRKETSNPEEKEERQLIESMNELKNCYKSKNKEKALDNFFNLIKGDKKYDGLFLRNGNMSRSLTYNSLTDLDVNEALDCLFSPQTEEMRFNYLSEVGNSMLSGSTQPNTLSTLLSQNLEIKDEVLKIMVIGSSMIGKTALINSFIEGNNFDAKKYVYYPTNGMEIRKDFLKLNQKNVKIEFYDTDKQIHQKDITQTFYKICDAFFYVVDSKRAETFEFAKSAHMKITNFSKSQASFYMFNIEKEENILTALTSVNVVNEENVELIKEFCIKTKVTYCQGKLSDFNQKNTVLLNYLNNVLIRKANNTNSKHHRKNKSSVRQYNSNDVYLMESSLSSFADYKMMESKEENDTHLPRRLTCRRLSYNQKIPKDN